MCWFCNPKNDCENRKVDDGYYKCCFFKLKVTVRGKTMDTKACGQLTKDQYKNLDYFIEKSKKQTEDAGGKVEKISVDCGSNY